MEKINKYLKNGRDGLECSCGGAAGPVPICLFKAIKRPFTAALIAWSFCPRLILLYN